MHSVTMFLYRLDWNECPSMLHVCGVAIERSLASTLSTRFNVRGATLLNTPA